MCILSYLPAEVDISDDIADDLWTGGLSNGDGHGWAISVDGGVVMRRTMSLSEAIDTFTDAKLRYPGRDSMFHSRFATHGSKIVDYCHPFIVGSDWRTVVAHNGILSNCLPAKGDPRSDTALLAQDVMPRKFRRLDKPSVRSAMERFIGKANKVCVITGNTRYRHQSYLFGEDRGEWCASTGVWHSNSDYRWGRYAPVKSDPLPLPHLSESVDSDCLICGQVETINALGFCIACGTCIDCYEPSDLCLCYVRKGELLATEW